MKILRLVAAKAEDWLIVRDGNDFYTRTPYAEDEKIPWEGGDPEMMLAALVTKWECDPVIGIAGEKSPFIMEDEAATIKKDTVDGAVVWRVVEVFKMNE